VSTRAGIVALAGRPNVGKSTLVNGLVGQKIAIVSDKPQTTRRAIRGVVTRGDVQLVLTDLPGVQRPRDQLTARMQRRVEAELADADAALFVVNAREGIGPGDRWIAEALKRSGVAVVMAVNKTDKLRPHEIAEVLVDAAALEVTDDVFPISARRGTGIDPLVGHLGGLVPEGPFLFDVEDATDQPLEVMLAELVREQVLKRTFQEVPHSVEVIVEGVEAPRDDLTVVTATAWVETDSQKGILVGRAGQMVRAIGTAARRELERELGTRVHLDLAVRVRKAWRTDERALDRLGIE
jgi:GTPase